MSLSSKLKPADKVFSLYLTIFCGPQTTESTKWIKPTETSIFY